MNLEQKQNRLKELDPEREECMSDMFIHYVAAIYGDNLLSRTRKTEEADEAEKVYERAIDEALADFDVKEST